MISRCLTLFLDGITYHKRSPSDDSLTHSELDPSPKVKFIPLSPKSSQTLRRHRRQSGDRAMINVDNTHEPSSPKQPQTLRKRSDSDTSFNRPQYQRHKPRGDRSPHSDDGEVEYLPDRFDSSGQPLEADRTLNGIPRRGSFEYLPRDGNDWHIRGAWRTIGDPDPLSFSELAQTFGGLLQPRGGLVGMLGDVLRDI